MALINLLGTNTSGKSLAATAQERVNLYYEPIPQADKSGMVAYGWPGVTPAYQELPTVGLVCGIYAPTSPTFMFVAATDKLYIYDPTQTGFGLYGSISYPLPGVGADKNMTWAQNQNTFPGEILFSASDRLFRLSLGTYTINLPTLSAGGGIGVSWLANRFITAIPATSSFAWSDLNNGNSWPALNFATAESVADSIVYHCVVRDTLILFGSRSIEFWTASPDLNLPFTRAYIAPSIGCASAESVVVSNDVVYFLGYHPGGGTRIYRISGYDVSPISTPDIDAVLEKTYKNSDSVTSYNAMFGSYVYFAGHGFYMLHGRSDAGELFAWSYAYDEATGIWSKIKTGDSCWTFNIAATGYVPTGGAVGSESYTTSTVVADRQRNVIYYLHHDRKTDVLTPQLSGSGLSLSLVVPQADNGTWQEKTLICPHVFDGSSLNNLVLSRVRLDMENPEVTGNFRVGLSISRDGGKTYGTEMLQNLSTTAGGISRCEWRRLGIARDYVFKFRFPDAGKIAIIGAYVETHLANR